MRFIGFAFALVFVGAPLTLLSMLWGDDGFNTAPFMMKIAGSLVCLGVGAVGVAMAYSALTGKHIGHSKEVHAGPTKSHKPNSYTCSHCGASIGADSEISPSGDVKCEFCNTWFNVNAK